MTDTDVVEQKIDIIEKNLDYLKKFRKMGESEFLSSYEYIQAAKHSVLEAVEACLDIAAHIIAAEGYERADEYWQMFSILEKRKIIPGTLSRKLITMAKFRNFLVHRYGEVDNELLLGIVKNDMKDVQEFARRATQFSFSQKRGSGRAKRRRGI